MRCAQVIVVFISAFKVHVYVDLNKFNITKRT